MKVVAFNGSPRPDGNTAALLKHVLATLNKEGIETELVQVENALRGCTACSNCFKTQNRKCVMDGDGLNGYIEKMAGADGILLGSPTYFADITPQMKALIDRAGYVSGANGHIFRRKVGAGVVAVRRGGEIHAFDSLNHFFTIEEMITVGSSYWNMGFGLKPGEVGNDSEGIATMTTLGRNMAWLLKKLA